MPQAEKKAAAEPKDDKATRPAPSADEQARITKAAQRIGSREPPPRVREVNTGPSESVPSVLSDSRSCHTDAGSSTARVLPPLP